ncbi:CCA tRNA nucleotidyltransferase [Candidatus Daviesbacteria bacterium]|nr:CCA tRNA nucleotidyltransferase [Candidatus Daviesbacteria bacterium]
MAYKIPSHIKNILDKFQKVNFQIFIVGGAVRDLLMDKIVSDWDFTTDAKPDEILQLFQEGFLERSSQKGSTFGEPFYDNKFGTVGIPTTTAEIYEITTMRKEGTYKDYRHPDKVAWTNKIEEDLARRDFTVNAMALRAELSSKNQAFSFILIDPFHGQDDLENQLIKAVGDPNTRFQEDALRLIRAVRFATELEFGIDEKTLESIKKNAHLLREIAWERIRDELFKILGGVNPYMGIVTLREVGILQVILPELERCFGIKQEGPKHDRIYDIGEHSLLTLKECSSKDPLVRLAALLHDVGKPDTVATQNDGNVTFYNHDTVGGQIALKIAKRFNLSNKQTDKLYQLVRWHLFTVDENQTDSAIRRFIKNVGVENIEDMMAVRIGDRLGGGTQKAVSWRMEKFRQRIKEVLKKPFSIADLKVNGNDVMKTLNIKPGPKVGEILQKLFEEVLEDSSKNNRKYLLSKIKQV